MPTLWDVVTGNSSLPVQAGNTFWDHLNSQQVSVGGGLPFPVQQLEVDFNVLNTEVNFTKEVNEVVFKDTTQEVNINMDSVGVDNVV